MRKIALSIGMIVMLVGYIISQKAGANAHLVTPPAMLSGNQTNTSVPANTFDTSSVPSGSAPNNSSGQSGSSQPPASVSPNQKSAANSAKAQYKDGTYTGPVMDAYYGPLQVAVTIQNGKITDVTFPQYPSDRNTSRDINGQAMPYFKQEAIVAQSANVDIVSGATASSAAFQESLAGALSQAQNI